MPVWLEISNALFPEDIASEIKIIFKCGDDMR